MKADKFVKDREPIIRADVWNEITNTCMKLRVELGYTNTQISEFLHEIARRFERDKV